MRRFLRRRDAAVVDFSRKGIALCTDNRFRVGDQIELQIKSHAEQITGIRGIVRYVVKERNEYSLGIEFEEDSDGRGRNKSSSSILRCMEKVVEHQLA